MTRDRLMLLDSASMYFRAFYGVPEGLLAPDGTPVNAVRGLLDMIARLVATRHPTRLVACWDDDWRPAFRVAAIPSYKAHRLAAIGEAAEAADAAAAPGAEEAPDALAVQVPVIVAALAALGIARVGSAGHEADDVIATLATRAVAAGVPEIEVVTGDRDLFQLVDDATGVRVLYIGRGLRDLEVVDQARLAEKYGVPTGDAYADLATLRGDASDGLPGVAGIGEKTATALLARYGDLAGILAAVDAGDRGLTPAQVRRLEAGRDYLAVAPAVVRTVRDAPVADVADALPGPPPPAVLADLDARWNLGGSLRRLEAALAGVHAAGQTTEE